MISTTRDNAERIEDDEPDFPNTGRPGRGCNLCKIADAEILNLRNQLDAERLKVAALQKELDTRGAETVKTDDRATASGGCVAPSSLPCVFFEPFNVNSTCCRTCGWNLAAHDADPRYGDAIRADWAAHEAAMSDDAVARSATSQHEPTPREEDNINELNKLRLKVAEAEQQLAIVREAIADPSLSDGACRIAIGLRMDPRNRP